MQKSDEKPQEIKLDPIVELKTKYDVEKFINDHEYCAIDFYINDCAPCKVMSESLEEVRKIFPNVHFAKCNDSYNNSPGQELYSIKAYPTLVVFEKEAPVGSTHDSRSHELCMFIKDRLF